MELLQTKPDQRGLKYYFWLAARGFAMGAADVVPGVSGGTMAFILGIYEELIHAIHAVNFTFISRMLTLRVREAFNEFPWQFLLALGLGIATAIFTLAEGLNWALHNHPVLVWAFFFGLVVASVVVVRKRVSRWTPSAVLALLLAAIGSFLLMGLVPTETPEAPWFLFLSGAMAIAAMVLPGISGAFILVLLGKYRYVLNAVVNRDIFTLLVVITGAAVGLVTFARLLRWMFRHYHDLTVAAMTGLMIGALRKVWPWKQAATAEIDGELQVVREINLLPEAFTPEVVLAILLALLGFGFVVLLEHLAYRRSPASG